MGEAVKRKEGLFKEGFFNYLEQELFCDFTIVLNPKHFKVHQLVLAYRSNFFNQKIQELLTNETATLVYELDLKDPEDIFPYVLKYLYTGDIEITSSNVVPLLSFATKLQLEELKYLVDTFLNNCINKTNAPMLLKKAGIGSGANSVVDKCLLLMARHFSDFVENNYPWYELPYEIMLQLLNHDAILVVREDDVYNTVKSYLVRFKKEELTEELLTTLFSTVRFASLEWESLEEALKNPLVPKSVLSEAPMVRLNNQEGKVPTDAPTVKIKRRQAYGKIFEYESDFDGKGVLHYISTNGNKESWSNPCQTGKIKITTSSTEKGVCSHISDLVPHEFWTQDVPSSWVCIDFVKGALKPTAYTIRHGGNSKQDCLRNWVLKCSNDLSNWVILKRHKNDDSLNSNFATHTWPIEICDKPYRYFRIIQTGHNSSNHNFLSISGLEFYGEWYFSNINVTQPPNNPGAV